MMFFRFNCISPCAEGSLVTLTESNIRMVDMEIRVGGKYRLGRKIGGGSFGEIYLGELTNDAITKIPLAMTFSRKMYLRALTRPRPAVKIPVC